MKVRVHFYWVLYSKTTENQTNNLLVTVAHCHNEDPVITKNIWKPGIITVKFVETNPAITNVLSCRSQWVKTAWWYNWLTSQTRLPFGQDRETLTFKALLYLNVAVHAQVCRLFCVVYIPLSNLVQLGYPAITNIFVVNQKIRYNGVTSL